MKSIANNLLSVLFGLVFIWAEFGGIYHSYSKHNDVLLAIFIPPVAWYRSVEFFWHDDYRGVDWDKKLQNDSQSCVYFLNQYNEEGANIYQLNKDLEKFSSQIHKYPDDKIEYLKTGSRIYIEWTALYLQSLILSYENYFKNGKFDFLKNDNILQLEQRLKIHGLGDLVTFGDETMTAVQKNLVNKNDENKQKTIEYGKKVIDDLKIRIKYQQSNFSGTYKNIFNEEF